MQRQHPCGRVAGGLLKSIEQGGAGLGGIGLQVVSRIDRRPDRPSHRGGQPRQRVLIGGADLGARQSKVCGHRGQQVFGGNRARRSRLPGPGVGQQRVVAPQRLAVAAPIQPDLPARQGFSGIPLALASLNQSLRRPLRFEKCGQHRGELTFMRTVGLGSPLRADLVVDRDEGGFASHRQPDVGSVESGVDLLPQCRDRRPCGVGIGQRDPGVFVDPGDGVGELKSGLGDAGGTADGRR